MIMVVLPSTCLCEQSIWSLRRLKDYTQSTMKSERLNVLAGMFIHRNIEIEPIEVLRAFTISNPNRRANFGTIP